VAIMQMEEGLDTGPVHRVLSTPIGPLETSGELFERLAPLGGQLLEQFLRELPDVPPPTPQDERGVVLAPMLAKAEGLTRWTCPVGQVVDHVRGMDPWPGAFTGRGTLVLKLFRARPSEHARPDGATPGQVLAVDRAGMHVACAEGVVCIAEVQVVGGKRMPAQAYAAGKPFAAGESLIDPPTPAE
jgi:methionyl-tRNA formyltransferase